MARTPALRHWRTPSQRTNCRGLAAIPLQPQDTALPLQPLDTALPLQPQDTALPLHR